MHSGVPQGSVLGPLLFLIFINDITECVHSLESTVITSMFADDTKLHSTVPSDMQSGIHAMTNWVNEHSLNLAFHKCSVLNISKPCVSIDSQFNISNTIIESKTFMKDLGVFISQNLKWAAHVDYIYNKASSASYYGLSRLNLGTLILSKRSM